MMRAPVAMRSTSAPAWREHLEHLARRGRDEKIEPRGHALRLEEQRGGEHVAQRGARVAAEDDLAHRLAGEIAHRAHRAGLVQSSGSTAARSTEMTSSHGAPGSGTSARWALDRR